MHAGDCRYIRQTAVSSDAKGASFPWDPPRETAVPGSISQAARIARGVSERGRAPCGAANCRTDAVSRSV
eukprot:3553995-Pyramimonas_sp.AAC.1